MGQAKLNAVSGQQPANKLNAISARLFTIGDLSREFDVSLRTLRFYEDRDLLHPERRGSTRFYSSGDRVRLQIILKGKKLGFTLTEIHEMLESEQSGDAADLQLTLNSEQVRAQIEHLERQRSDLDVAIDELRATHLRLSSRSNSAAA